MKIGDVVVGEHYAHSRFKPSRRFAPHGYSRVRVLDKDASIPHGYSGSGHIRGLTVCDAMGKEKQIPARELWMTWAEFEEGRDRVQREQMARIQRSDALERHRDSIKGSLEKMEIEAEVKVWSTPALHIVFKEPIHALSLAQILADVSTLPEEIRVALWANFREAGFFNGIQ